MILITNARIKPIQGRDIANGQILVDGGKIAAIGKKVQLPKGSVQVIDAKGQLVTPGLVEGHCHVGVAERLGGFATSDHNEKTDPVTPQLRIMDSFNPMGDDVSNALHAGITTAITCPGSANVVGGTCMAVKLCGKRVEDMILKQPVAMKVAFGENAKRVYGNEAKKAPCTRMDIAYLLRDLLARARKYMEKRESDEGCDLDLKLEAMIPVLKKEIPLKAHAHSANDIFTAIRIAKEFDVDLTIDHCTDGALIAEELAKEGYPVLLGPSWGAATKFELVNKGFDTVAKVQAAGNRIAIITDSPVTPLEYLPLCAGLAVKEGLPEKEAWKAITINPAKFYGLENRVGSLEVGKDADIVIWTGNPILEIGAKPSLVMVNGQAV